MCGQPVSHGGIASGQRAQCMLVVGVGQHAHIKHIVRMHRNAAFESERFKHQGQLRGFGRNERLDVALQLGVFQQAGVNDVRLFA